MLSTCTKYSNALLGRQVKLTEGIFKKPIFFGFESQETGNDGFLA